MKVPIIFIISPLVNHLKDTSASRYMISTKVSDPFVIEGTEWVSIKIHGQSFMLHQIRKMIAMATMVVRLSLPSKIINNFSKKIKLIFQKLLL